MKRLLFALILAPIAMQAVDSGAIDNDVAMKTLSNKASSGINGLTVQMQQALGSDLMKELSAQQLQPAIEKFIQSDKVSVLVNKLAKSILVNNLLDALSEALESASSKL